MQYVTITCAQYYLWQAWEKSGVHFIHYKHEMLSTALLCTLSHSIAHTFSGSAIIIHLICAQKVKLPQFIANKYRTVK